MTNEEKYKTPKERTEAFNAFCLVDFKDCKRNGVDCPCFSIIGNCAYAWLSLNA
jgi:hypothetical protein